MTSLTAVSDRNVSDGNRRGQRVFSAFGRHDGDRVFRSAVRHSRHVRLLRLAVPGAVVLVVLGGIAFWALAKPLSMLAKLPIDMSSLVVSGTKIMMQQPRMAGFTRDNRRYEMTAEAAGQDITKPDLVELHGIHAKMEMKDNDQFETTARDGLYDSKTDLLTLNKDIVVTSKSGYHAWMNEAVIDIKGGKIKSEKPVRVTTDAWAIDANSMEVAESGDFMRFDRGVTVVLTPQANPKPEADARKR
jgi:lipopolysaccharide export system protein LptC